MAKKPVLAIMYDFDKTLSSQDMQNFSFIPALGMTPKEFWTATGEFSEKTNMERILSYMYMMVHMAKEKGIHLTKSYLRSLGKDIHFYEGVNTWFQRINEYGKALGVKVEHYLVSSGTKEIVEGSSIANAFTKIWGCEFYYDESGEPVWPKMTINYTMKTQFYYRIAKGTMNLKDDNTVNQHSKVKHVKYQNFVYIGDGITDIPCMTLVKENGGKSIAVYARGKKETVSMLAKEERVNFICEANYSPNSQLEKVVKMIINQVSITESLTKLEHKNK